ncbi:MAG: hypothetical protein U0L47_08135 [Paludibacteraceae bacterium]|nr:hypothetical protein [Paludibacteraceae bacterium]
MKRFFSLAICVMALLFIGCEEHNTPATSSKVETGAASDITTESVVLHGVVNVDISLYEDVEYGMMVSESLEDLNNRDGEMYKAKVLIGKDFELMLEGLFPETKYYYCAWLFLNNTQYEFGVIKEFETIKENTGNTDNPNSSYKAKAFSVTSSKQVYFSPGNLQYHPANEKWRFAENQTDYIGEDNSNISDTYNGWLDLFGWSTASTYFGVSTSKYGYYGSFVDWGTNKIGDDAPNTWRTLTHDEWDYVVFNRPNASSLRGVAQVNGVNGLILLPDNWTCPAGVTFKSGFHSSEWGDYAAYQIFTAEQWSKLESAGTVFLPAAGYRDVSYVSYVQRRGYYWSASEDNDSGAYPLDFNSGAAGRYGGSRYCGRAVRLVKDLQ